MRNPENDISKELKREADQSLFQNMDFDEEMKERVRERVHSNTRKNSIPMLNWQRYAAIASVAIIVLVASSILFSPDEKSDKGEQGANELSNFSSEDKITNPIAGTRDRKTWEVQSQDELKQVFSGVMLPTYDADVFQQESIQLVGTDKNNPNKAILTYVHDDQSYLVIIEKNVSQLKPVGFDTVDINGINGYLNGEDKNLSELHFYTENYHYTINGMLSSEEALKVGRSFE